MKAADKLIAIALAVGSLLFLGWLVLRFFLPATLPFWLGLTIAALLRPVSLLFSQKLHLRRRRAAAFVMTLFYLLLGLLLWLALLLLWSWLSSLTARAPQLYRTVFLPATADFFEWLSRFLSRFSPDLAQTVALWRQSFSAAAAQLSASLSSSLLKCCTSFAACTPHFFFGVVVTILCSSFISLDYPRVTQFLLRLLPPSLRSLACEMKHFLFSTLFCMAKAYLILMAVTFSALSCGLWLLEVPNFFPVALLTSLLDLLPVIGIGFILIPWAVISLFQGNRLRAVAVVSCHQPAPQPVGTKTGGKKHRSAAAGNLAEHLRRLAAVWHRRSTDAMSGAGCSLLLSKISANQKRRRAVAPFLFKKHCI